MSEEADLPCAVLGDCRIRRARGPDFQHAGGLLVGDGCVAEMYGFVCRCLEAFVVDHAEAAVIDL